MIPDLKKHKRKINKILKNSFQNGINVVYYQSTSYEGGGNLINNLIYFTRGVRNIMTAMMYGMKQLINQAKEREAKKIKRPDFGKISEEHAEAVSMREPKAV